jgi:hypothetical protein
MPLIVLQFGIVIGILVPQPTHATVGRELRNPINKIPLFGFVKANYTYTVITTGKEHRQLYRK